jgi:hypothetical protein
MSLDLTTFNSALKTMYSKDRVENLTYNDHPFLAMVKKNENFGGDFFKIVLQFGNPQGRSATFANARTQAAATSSLVEAFYLTRAKDHSIVFIEHEAIEAAKGGGEKAFLDALTTEIDGAIATLSASIATKLFKDNSGYVAQIVEPVSATAVIALKNVSDVVHFEIGQVVEFFAAKSGGSALVVDTGIAQPSIVAVDRSAGTITVSTAYSLANGTLVDDAYIFILGDRGLALSGLEGWIPASAPTSTTFFGVDRSVDTNRLGGIRYNGSALDIDVALINAANRLGREGGNPDVCFMSYEDLGSLVNTLGPKVQYVDVKVAEVGFRGVNVIGPKGNIRCIADANCPIGVAYMLTMKTWSLYSLGKAVRPVNSNGEMMTLSSSSNAYEVRHVFYGNLGCNAPGYNCRVTLPALS